MNDSTQTIPAITIGLDLGDKWSFYCVIDRDGEMVEEGRVKTTPEALQKHFCVTRTDRQRSYSNRDRDALSLGERSLGEVRTRGVGSERAPASPYLQK